MHLVLACLCEDAYVLNLVLQLYAFMVDTKPLKILKSSRWEHLRDSEPWKKNQEYTFQFQASCFSEMVLGLSLVTQGLKSSVKAKNSSLQMTDLLFSVFCVSLGHGYSTGKIIKYQSLIQVRKDLLFCKMQNIKSEFPGRTTNRTCCCLNIMDIKI